MARNYRFFVNEKVLSGNNFWLTESNETDVVFQLKNVLRVKSGDGITLLNGDGNEYLFEVSGMDKKNIELKFIEKKKNNNELDFDLELLLCLPNKPDKLEMILQKAVEIGAKKIVLVEAEFSQMKHQLRLDRLQKIVKEAAEQSERGVLPEVVLEGNLGQFLKNGKLKNIYVAMERSENVAKVNYEEQVCILVGPEGGFSEAEKALFKELNLNCFTLGKRVLRMETAAIVALGLAAVKKL